MASEFHKIDFPIAARNLLECALFVVSILSISAVIFGQSSAPAMTDSLYCVVYGAAVGVEFLCTRRRWSVSRAMALSMKIARKFFVWSFALNGRKYLT